MKPIIIEGCDGSGKTFLIEEARHACKTYFWSMRGMARPPTDWNCILDVAATINQASRGAIPIIVDRHPYISEPIYGPALRGQSRIPISMIPPTRQYLAVAFDRIIWCCPPWMEVAANVNQARQLAGVLDSIEKIYKEYEFSMYALTNTYRARVIRYDYTDQNKPELEELLFGDPK